MILLRPKLTAVINNIRLGRNKKLNAIFGTTHYADIINIEFIRLYFRTIYMWYFVRFTQHTERTRRFYKIHSTCRREMFTIVSTNAPLTRKMYHS